MTYFKEALSAPALHFKRLRQAEPLLYNGEISISRTQDFIETEILIDGRHFLLSLPFHTEKIQFVEELEAIARERSRGPLLENYILYDEFLMTDSLGKEHHLDVILQDIPPGLMLNEAVKHYRADDLKAAIKKMKNRLDAIGFCHNNLKPTNLIICNSGIARPLRYWHARWEVFSNNNISQLLDFIDNNSNHCYEQSDEILLPLYAKESEAEYRATPTNFSDIKRIIRCHRYGFEDCDGAHITDFEYSWASDFCEGRAIVCKNGKMGVIDSNGKKIITVNYDNIEFDINTGFFTATKAGYCYLKSYEGKTIRRTKIEERESVNIEVQCF